MSAPHFNVLSVGPKKREEYAYRPNCFHTYIHIDMYGNNLFNTCIVTCLMHRNLAINLLYIYVILCRPYVILDLLM